MREAFIDPASAKTFAQHGIKPKHLDAAVSAFPEEVTPAERALLKRRTVLIMVAVSTTVLLLVADLTLLCFFASGANKRSSA